MYRKIRYDMNLKNFTKFFGKLNKAQLEEQAQARLAYCRCTLELLYRTLGMRFGFVSFFSLSKAVFSFGRKKFNDM